MMTTKFSKEDIEEILLKRSEPFCLSYKEIAGHFNVDRKTIARLIGKTLKHNDTRGENNAHHVLTEKDVKEMREIYYATDLSYRDIAKEYGVAKSTCLRAITGESWKCVS